MGGALFIVCLIRDWVGYPQNAGGKKLMRCFQETLDLEIIRGQTCLLTCNCPTATGSGVS